MHKQNSGDMPANYQGIQLTAQIPKAVGRLLCPRFVTSLLSLGAFPPMLCACTKERGARNVLLFVLRAPLSLGHGERKTSGAVPV